MCSNIYINDHFEAIWSADYLGSFPKQAVANISFLFLRRCTSCGLGVVGGCAWALIDPINAFDMEFADLVPQAHMVSHGPIRAN